MSSLNSFFAAEHFESFINALIGIWERIQRDTVYPQTNGSTALTDHTTQGGKSKKLLALTFDIYLKQRNQEQQIRSSWKIDWLVCDADTAQGNCSLVQIYKLSRVLGKGAQVVPLLSPGEFIFDCGPPAAPPSHLQVLCGDILEEVVALAFFWHPLTFLLFHINIPEMDVL